MNLYQIITGEYSDRSEDWYSHERKMTQQEFGELLLKTWIEVTKPRLAKLREERNAEYRRLFDEEYYPYGPTPGGAKGNVEKWRAFQDQHYFELDSLLMRDAGFEHLEPCARTHLTPPWREDDEEFEKELVHELAKVESHRSNS